MFTITEFPLPYPTDALVPYISAETLQTHHGKHVATYIDNLNKLIQDTPYQEVSLTGIIKQSANNPQDKKIFNNAAQIYNHNFFFAGMCPNCKTQIPSEIINAFGSEQKFKDAFKTAATSPPRLLK